MAILALRDTVPTRQREFRLVVIKARVFPRRIAVTACAIFTQLTFVSVVFTMTRHAGGFEFFHIQRIRMALVTRQRYVSTTQGKLGQLVVIKTRLFPVMRVVTRLTPISVVTLV